MKPLTPHEAMALALAEGRRGSGFVSPNPLVGCVILDRDGRLLAKGYHARLGDLHAETHALAQIADLSQLEGAQVYVTLEPCAHEGRQPSCAKHMAKLPIASVTYGLIDPNPRVAGQGVAILRAAGKRVGAFEGMRSELEELAEVFLLNQRQGRAFAALKVASSLDGQVALSDGSSQWITGEGARGRVQTLRGEYDAVLTGAGTFLKDNPRLNSRDPRYRGKPQRVVLLDVEGVTLNRLADSALLEVRSPQDILVVTRPGISVPAGIGHLEMPASAGEFDLRDLLIRLRQMEIHSVFIEAGPAVASSFLRQKLVDRLFLFLAPKLLGKGLAWSQGFAIPTLAQAVDLNGLQVERLGEDILLSARPQFV